MSKFKCTENSMDFVEVLRDKEGRPALTVGDNHSVSVAFLDPSDAPALALAILEAAGYRPVAYDPERLSGDDLLAYIAHRLAVHVGDEAKHTAEAEAQAKLEAEALELYNAWREANDYDALSSFSDGAPIGAMAEWLAVARKAREMSAEK